MNFIGKFDANLPPDDLGSHPHAYVHVEKVTGAHAPSDAIIVPDAQLLFHGDFKRSGVDLVLSKDGHELVLEDYFKGEKRAALASPDGAHLTGKIIDALAGHVQYAQADGNSGAAHVIGHVAKLTGTATAVRNGVSITLNLGDNVEKGDVVQSGDASTVGITFIDGTVFGLSSNARMVLNEMVYDPNGSNNSSLISLVAGTISFVAGETAKHGDMKIDTPVATMGIRGTAVAFKVDFNVQYATPDAEFLVLYEPDGHIGSYKLYEKGTDNELYTVDEHTPHVHYHNGAFTPSSIGLPADVQKLVTDLFALKFSDNNTKSNDHHTDIGVINTLLPFYSANPLITAPVFVAAAATSNTGPSNSNGSTNSQAHVPIPPAVLVSDNAFTERADVTGSPATDSVSGLIQFDDLNRGDQPTATSTFTSFTYQNAQGVDVTATLSGPQSAQLLADIVFVETQLVIVASPKNSNVGTATWTYSLPDKDFDFLAAGETLTLTYTVEVDSNFAPDNLKTFVPFTITITGTNDAPLITTSQQTINFSGGKGTPGGDLPITSETSGVNLINTAGVLTESGALTFTDPDLTDTHTIVSTDLTGASLSGTTLTLAQLETAFPLPFGIFETALSASVTTDSTGTGTGTITWELAELKAYLADFVPAGETLTLTYTVVVEDEHGAMSQQNIVVTITGNNTPAVVWIETVEDGSPDPGNWNEGSNWETGTVPTASNDVIIITDQLQGKTPYYPVTIDAAAVALSLTMNDFGVLFTNSPTLINNSTLTVGTGGVSLGADAIIDNYGTITVAGQLELQDESSLHNYGQLTLQDGGDFKNSGTVTIGTVTYSGSVTNSGTIEVAGGTLNIQVDVDNSGQITIDSGATLALNGGTIDGGTIDDGNTLSVTGSSEIDNATINGGGRVTVASGQVLTLDAVTLDGVTLAGSFTDASTVTIDNTVTLDGATISGGTIDDTGTLSVKTSSKIESATVNGGGTLSSTASGQTLTLDTVTLDNVTLAGSFTDASTVTIDNTVTLDGATISGGTIKDTGTLSVTTASEIENSTVNGGGTLSAVATGQALTLDTVTLDGVTLAGSFTDASTVTIDNTVTLDGATISGGTIDDTGTLSVTTASEIENATVNGGGTLSAVATGQALTLDTVTLDGVTLTGSITDASTVTIDNTVTLDGATISGGTIKDTGTLSVTTASEIENSTVNGGGTLSAVATGQALTLDTVTLDGVTLTGSITDASTVTIDNTVTLDGATISGGTIKDTGTLSVTTASEIENSTVNGGGTLSAVATGQALTLDTVTLDGVTLSGVFTDASTVTIDNTVTLDSATISGGTIKDTGTLSVTTASEIENSTVNGGGTLSATASGQTLTLDTVTLDGVTLSGSFTDASTVTIDNTVTLDGATISGGTIDDTGTLSVKTSSKIESATVNGGGTLSSTASGQTLTLDTVTLDGVTLAGSFTDASTVTIDNTVTLDGATISGGTIDDTGTLSVKTSSKIESATVNGGGTLSSTASGQTLTLDTVTLDGVTLSGVFTDASTVTIDNTVTLDGATISGGTIKDTGTLSVKTSSEIENATVNGGGTLSSTASGQTLTLDTVTLDNVTLAGSFTDASTVTIDNTVTLDGATISGGTIDDTGTLSVKTSSEIESATVNGGGTLSSTASGQTLTLDTVTLDGVTLAGSFTDASTVTIDNTVTLDGATISGGTIKDTGTLSVTTASEIENSTVNGGGTLSAVATGQALTLDTVTLDGVTLAGSFTDASTVTIDNTVTLDGATISGGTIKDTGTLSVTTASEIENSTVNGGGTLSAVATGQALTLDTVTLDGVTLTGSFTDASTVTIDNTVTLDGATISGGTIKDTGTLWVTTASEIENSTVNGGGTLSAVATGQALTLDTVTLDGVTLSGVFTDASTVTIDNTVTLDGATISGGTIDDTGTLSVKTSSKIESATVNGGGTLSSTASGQTLTLDTVTLDGVTLSGVFTDASTVTIDNTVTLDGATISGGTIDDTGTLSVTTASEIENATVNGGGTLSAVATGQALTLDTVTLDGVTLTGSITDASTVTIDNTVTLDGATISGGTIKDTGTLSVTTASEIENSTVNGGGTLSAVATGQALTLDTVTLDGVTLSGVFTDASTVTIDNTVTLDGATISGGTIKDTGTLSVTTASEIENSTVNGGGTLSAVATGQALTLDTVTLDGVTLSGVFTDASTVTIDNTVTLDSATISGGTIKDTGTLSVTTASEIENSTVNGGGTLSATASGQTLTLDTVTLDGVTLSGSFTDASTVTIDNTVTLDGATISGGTIDDTGTLSVKTSSKIESATVNGGGTLSSTASGQTLTLDTVTLDGVTLAGSFTDASTVTIDNTVTLDGATISGGTIDDTGTLSVKTSSKIESATVNGGGTLSSTASGQTLTLDTVTLDGVTLSGVFTDASTVTIDNTVTLDGATISGGTIKDTGTLSVKTSSEIENATVNGGGTLSSTASGQTLTLDTVTLDGVTLAGSFTDASTVTIDNTVTLDGATISGGTIDDTGTLSVKTSSEIESATVNGGGTLSSTASGQTLTLDTVTLDGVTLAGSFTDASTVTIDNTVTLDGATISGGTIKDTGTLSVTTASEIENSTVNGGGTLSAVATGQALTLDTVTLDNVTLAGSFTDASTVTIDNTVTLDGATISGGTIDDTGTLSVKTSSKIESATVNGGGTLSSTASGQTLTLDTVTLDGVTLAGSFTDASTVTIDNTVTLDGATISGGDLTITAGSTLDVEAVAAGGIATTLDGVTVNGVDAVTGLVPTAASTIEVGATSTATLLLDDGTTITNGNLTIGSGGTLDVEIGSIGQGGAAGAGNPDATLDNVNVANSGTIEVGETTTGAILYLSDGTVVTGGAIDIAANAEIYVQNSATLDGVTVDNGGEIGIGGLVVPPTGSTLTLVDGTTISGGELSLENSADVVDVEIGSVGQGGAAGAGNPDATLDNVDVANSGTIEVGETTSGALLYLQDGTTITGGTLSTANGGLIEVAYNSALSDNTVTFDGSQAGDPLTINGAVQVDAGATLTLLGTIDNNGTITVDANVIVPAGATLLISGDVTLDGNGNGSVVLDGTTDAITGNSAADILENVNNEISGYGQLGDGKLTLINDTDGTIVATDATNALIINTGTGAFTNDGLVHSDGAGGLKISGDVTNNGTLEATSGILKVDGNVTSDEGGSDIALIDGGTMEFGGASNANVQFSGAGTLVLDDFNFTGTISGFGAGDAIDLTDNLKLSSNVTDVWNSATDTLTISSGGVVSVALTFITGSYGQNSFALTTDANGNTEIVSTAAQVSVSGFDSAGNAAEGSAVTATLTDLNGATDITYQWLDNGEVISGATGASYTPVAGNVGDVLDVVVTFTEGGITEQITALAGTVAAAPTVSDTTDGTSVTTGENTALTLTGLTVTDADAGSNPISVTLSVAHGTLTLGTAAGVTETIGSNGAITLSGTVAAIDALLATGVTYTPNSGFTGTDTLTYQATDGSVSSNSGSVAINVADPPSITTDNIALVSQDLLGGSGEHQGVAVTFADGHLYLSYNNGPENQDTSDNADIVEFNTSPDGATQTFTYAWSKGDFFGLAADGSQIYAVGESTPNDGLTHDGSGGTETKSIFVRFDANGQPGSGPSSSDGDTATNFYSYRGVESFNNVVASDQNGTTVYYALGFGQPASYSGYVIGEYSSDGTLLATATDNGSLPGGSSANGGVDWNGAIWAVGSSQHNQPYGNATVWEFSYDLSSVITFEDNVGGPSSFNAVTTIGNQLYAVGNATVAGGQDYLIADYNSDGSIAWSDSFGAPGATSTLSGAVTLNGELYVIGSTTSGGITEGVLMEIDPTTGAVISTVTYDPGQYNNFTSITTDGHYLYIGGVTGTSSTNDQAVLLTYDVGGLTTTTVEDTAVHFNSLAVSDANSGSNQIEVTLSVGHGTVALENISGLDSVVNAGTGTVELFGSQAAINAALAAGVVYDPNATYTGSDTLVITTDDLGHNPTGVALTTTQDISITVTAADTIADGATYTVSAPSGDTIAFATGNGTLDLTQPATFTGEIAGITGSGDILDIQGFSAGTTTATTGAGSFNSITDVTTLTVTDSSDHLTETFNLAGDLSGSTWTVTSDGHGGINIVDPPAASPLEIAAGASLEIANPVASGENVTFDGSTGHLTLDAPSTFDGLITGFTGDGTLAGSDQIDLKGIDYNSSSFTESFDAATDTLSISDGTNSATLHFSGSYQAANFSFTTDDNGGTIVFDPPVPNGAGPQTPVQSQTQAGGDGNSHGFTFNFTSNDFHPTPDSSGGQLPWTPPAGPNSTAGHPAGLLLVSPEMAPHLTSDVHSTTGAVVSSLIEAQTHANGFHLV